KHLGVFLASFIFSLFHFQFYGFLPRFVLGMFLGYLLVWSGNIWYPIIAHFVNNTAAVVAFYYINTSNIEFDIENVGATTNTFIYGILSAGFAVFLFGMFYRMSLSPRRP